MRHPGSGAQSTACANTCAACSNRKTPLKIPEDAFLYWVRFAWQQQKSESCHNFG
jgi:hypothetical protein